MAEDAVRRQREYYARTAELYETHQVHERDEHDFALAAFAGLARLFAAESVLDVGAGTGRALTRLRRALPEARLVGIEPVAELRAIGHKNGLSEETLRDGDALALPFADDSFDFVIETGVLHHVPRPKAAIAEMMRVARVGVMISDSNNYGQGSLPARAVKNVIAGLGLWRAWTWLVTRGKMAKWSEGDGVFYSYSLTDDLALVARKFPRQMVANTGTLTGLNLKLSAPHLMLFAVRE